MKKLSKKKKIVLVIVCIVIFVSGLITLSTSPDDTSDTNGTSATSKPVENKNEVKEELDEVLYQDDNFKITFVDFKDPKVGVTSYNLLLKIENNSEKTVIVSPSDGYANDELVFLGSGLPVKINPHKKATGAFVVGYGNTSIQSIEEIKTLELKLTLYDENYSEKVLETGNLVITLE